MGGDVQKLQGRDRAGTVQRAGAEGSPVASGRENQVSKPGMRARASLLGGRLSCIGRRSSDIAVVAVIRWPAMADDARSNGAPTSTRWIKLVVGDGERR